jgi:ABC-type transport system involved in multi-copper enzyme maturation permease subunit
MTTANGSAEAAAVINSISGPVGVFVLILGTMLVVLIGIVFVAIAIAFSAAARSSTVATWGAVGLVILFAFLWDTVLFVVRIGPLDDRAVPPD